MSPRAENVLHSVIALALVVAVMAGVTWLGYHYAGARGLRGAALNNWMTWWFAGGFGAGAVVFIAYQRWFMQGVIARREALRLREQDEERRKNMAVIEARQEALRQELRATPGLERYAELVGRSTIQSVEDARKREVRVAELRADPVKARYAERVFNGETITDAMIAYWENPAARVLCAHLAALEAEIRAASPHAHPGAADTLEAPFSFDFEALKRRYRLDDPVTFWRQPFGPQFYGRGEENYDGWEHIECAQHRCKVRGAEHRPPFPARP